MKSLIPYIHDLNAPRGSDYRILHADERNRAGTQNRPASPRAHITETGVAFSVYAHQATAVELCLVTPDSDNNYRENRYRLRGPENGIWHGHIPGIRPGQIYGYRAYGPWNPDAGLFYNPQKILLDPYAKAITGTPHLGPRLYATR
ncbi:hypothetical protein [Mobiluncus mulieris]|uniref:hypothetical protein n=1 Tax=Mobiluncus mulieris TaxID=2052 RepID=UPI002092FB33|nr:hypothetical protein [Mobiluncus mulieris]